MRRSSPIVAALLAAGVMTGHAQAQQAGSYDATLSDGATVHFVVDENPSTHRPRVIDAEVVLPAPCPGLPTPIEPTTWSWSPNADLIEGGGRTIFRAPDDSFFFAFVVKGLSTNRIIMTTKHVSTVIVPVGGGGFRASMCNRRQWQRLELTYSATPARPAPARAGRGS